jgi:kynurenine formamidase
MSRVIDAPFEGWTPPAYTVGADGKVSGAQPGEWNNWGRWGEDDQLGTVNLLTAERVAHAATLIRSGERFSLGLPIGIERPSRDADLERGRRHPPSRNSILHFFGCAAGDGVLGDTQAQLAMDDETFYQYSDDFLIVALQHTTQLDGFGAGRDHSLYNGYWAGLVTARSGARRLGMHNRARGIVGRAVLLDLANHLGVDRLADRFRIGPELVLEVAEAQGVEIGAGDILLMRTGWLGWWYAGGETENPGIAPGVGAEIVPLLKERDIAMVAFDNVTSEVIDPEDGRRMEFHVAALRDLGLQVGEYFDLDELAAACRKDGIYEMFFVASPLPVVGGAGSPLNPIAIR